MCNVKVYNKFYEINCVTLFHLAIAVENALYWML